jgi:hypothetical protein
MHAAVFFHPDFALQRWTATARTVGSGIGPDLLTFRPKPEALAGSGLAAPTAGGEFHPALKTFVVDLLVNQPA